MFAVRAPSPAALCAASSPLRGEERAAESSSSLISKAMGWFTGTWSVPSGSSSFSIRPSSTASTSMVALSVSISAMTSPDLTISPSFTCHLASLPTSMVGESCGMRISIVMSDVQDAGRHGFFPVLAVKQGNPHDAYGALVEAAHVHAEAIRLGAGHVEALYSAYGAKSMLSGAGVECVGGELVFAGQQPEALLRHD